MKIAIVTDMHIGARGDSKVFQDHQERFFMEVFFPYLIGGMIPGLIAGLAGYYLSLPVIQAYQNRRKGALKAKWDAIREKAAQKADAKNNQD